MYILFCLQIDINEAARRDGKLLLLGSAGTGHDKCLEILLNHGADCQVTSGRNHTALHLAAQGGHENCVRILLEAGTNLYELNEKGESALMQAIQRAHYGCMEILIKAGAIMPQESEEFEGQYAHNALCCAAQNGRHKALTALINAGVLVNNNNPIKPRQRGIFWTPSQVQRISPLIYAADKVGQRILYLSDPFATNPDNNDSDYLICVIKLLKAGIQINKENEQSRNALELHLLRQGMGFDKDIVEILYVAGEKIHPSKLALTIPGFLQLDELRLCLKHLCREAIRKHLIDIDPHEHLFGRIPRLGLPDSISSYLLYDISLEIPKHLEQIAKEHEESSSGSGDCVKRNGTFVNY